MGFTVQELTTALSDFEGQTLTSLQVIAATELANQYYPHVDPGQPALVLRLDDQELARQVQPTLLRAYPAEHEVVLVWDGTRRSISLVDLSAQADLNARSRLLLPALPAPSSYAALQDVVAHLRAPEGCPWDQDQTWARLRATLLEESYELLSALDVEDPHKVAEELGDLLLQVGMQTQIATEEGFFRLPDVIQGIVSKLIRRHPHVFGDAVVSGAEEVLANWEAIKRIEREGNGEHRSPLSGVPKGLPALAQAEAYLDRMSRLGAIDVPSAPWEALRRLSVNAPVPTETLGDALFGLVAWARAHGLDAESALRLTNARYAQRVEADGI
jgi:tetrapyrrole methylase family protein / MazG family protein